MSRAGDGSDAVVVLELDATARAQLRAVLRELPRLARANGVRVAPALRALAQALDRSKPLEPTQRDTEPTVEDGGAMQPLLYDYRQTGVLLGGVSEDTIVRLVKAGQLPAVNVGRRRLIPAEAVVAYVERLAAA